MATNPLEGWHTPTGGNPVAQHGVMHGTAATRHIHALSLGQRAVRRRGKKKALAHAPRAKKHAAAAPRARRGGAKFVKGSRAARAHMAKLRAMKGKKAAA